MIEFLKGWILNIATLAVFIVLLEMLVPSGKLKKFVNLIAGFILLIAIINPFLGLLKNGVDLKELQLANSNILEKSEIEEGSKVLNERQMRQISEVYRKNLVNRIEEGVMEIAGVSNVRAEVVINEDYNSKSFGEIRKVNLNLELKGGKSGEKSVAKVEKVEVKANNTSRENTKSREVDEGIRKQIGSKLNKILNVDEKVIEISLRKS
jgi:stage III sporulation protein AF